MGGEVQHVPSRFVICGVSEFAPLNPVLIFRPNQFGWDIKILYTLGSVTASCCLAAIGSIVLFSYVQSPALCLTSYFSLAGAIFCLWIARDSMASELFR